MRKSKRRQKIKILRYRWRSQIWNTRIKRGIINYFRYFRDMRRYKKMEGAEPIKFIDTYPRIYDKTSTTPFEAHYLYQGVWAFKRIYESKCDHHVDVGSSVRFVSYLAGVTKVTFIDIRPFMANIENLESKKGTILSIPYETVSVSSLSCLHVAEHIGLGRYGDPLDPLGTKKAAEELSRVLAPGGNLYFSVPIGLSRLCFNAHRIHSTQQILDYFSDLTLVELSGIDDKHNFITNIDRKVLDACEYGCGLFWFTKKQ